MWKKFTSFLKHYMPTGLLPRSLLIVIVPVLIMQIVVAFVFMERHWTSVTQNLSRTAVSDISFLANLRMREVGGDGERLSQMAGDIFNMSVAFLSGESLPDTREPSSFGLSSFELLHQSLSRELQTQIGRPFSVDTTTYDNYVDIRILLPGEVMRVLALRKRVYATNSHIFISWMVGTTAILLGVAGVFLRNQIRPITKLAEAAEEFGKGRNAPNFQISGASEVRRAASSFIEMRNRIERQIEQRTTMLAGVSHDLRTPLTRLKLQLAMLPPQAGVSELNGDVQEMENMLEDYLSFARGYQGESAVATNFSDFIEHIHQDAERRWQNTQIRLTTVPQSIVHIKPKAFSRCITNLINNACVHAKLVHLAAYRDKQHDILHITIDDNGVGMSEDKMEYVFRPFVRLDSARTDTEGSGLGLTIARDVARGAGGDVTLSRSALGGLCAHISIPI